MGLRLSVVVFRYYDEKGKPNTTQSTLSQLTTAGYSSVFHAVAEFQHRDEIRVQFRALTVIVI